MKNARKLALLAGCVAASFALQACNNQNEIDGEQYDQMEQGWVITNEENKNVLYEAQDIRFFRLKEYTAEDNSVGYRLGQEVIDFVAVADNTKHVAYDYFVFEYETKPSKEFYDIEYGKNLSNLKANNSIYDLSL